MTLNEMLDGWYRRHGVFFARRFRLMLVRHTWGKSINTPMHRTMPPIGLKAAVLMNDLLCTPEFHEYLNAEAVAWRQRLHNHYLKTGGISNVNPVVSTDVELIKAQEALIHTFEHGLNSLEPASQYEIEQLRLAEPRLKS